MELIHPRAGGIDVGSEKLHVAVCGGPVQVFETFTASLHAVRDYLLSAGVRSVAMEATGVYWLPIYEVLEEAGIEVYVVNGAHVKSLPGRKSDMADCQWLAKLHSHGLLRSGFVPDEWIRRLRDYQRLRQDHVQIASSHILHMQKALDRMNVKIHEVLSDLMGASGRRLVQAILEGERDSERLLALCDAQVLRKKKERMHQALQGHWKAEHLFALRQALQGWEFYQQQIAACDREIEGTLQEIAALSPPADAGAAVELVHKRICHNAPQITDLKQLLVRITGGHDLAALPAFTDYSILQLVAETGPAMTAWPTAKHFTAWSGLAPSSRQSGKRRRREPRFRNRTGRLFCVMARSLARSNKIGLGGFYRRLRATRGPAVANVATARKLAVLYYNTLRYGLGFVEQGLEAYEQHYRAQSLRRLRATARQFGMVLMPLANVA
ncbi:MAG: IS110 family transposase [Steroidobacteraceae bacterium]